MMSMLIPTVEAPIKCKLSKLLQMYALAIMTFAKYSFSYFQKCVLCVRYFWQAMLVQLSLRSFQCTFALKLFALCFGFTLVVVFARDFFCF